MAHFTAVFCAQFAFYASAAAAGMNLFASTKTHVGSYVTKNANFDSFGLSVMTMIRALTGEQVGR